MLQTYLMMIDTREDEERFVLLYERYKGLMKYVADRILHDRNLAEDAVHEAFIKIAKNFNGVGEIMCPETKNFVVVITRRAALDMIQKDQRHRQNLSLDEMMNEDVDGNGYMSPNFVEREDDSVFNEVNQKVLVREILGLPERYREVMYIHGVYGYSLAETANLLGITEEAAKKRMQRGRAILQKRIEGGERFE